MSEPSSDTNPWSATDMYNVSAPPLSPHPRRPACVRTRKLTRRVDCRPRAPRVKTPFKCQICEGHGKETLTAGLCAAVKVIGESGRRESRLAWREGTG